MSRGKHLDGSLSSLLSDWRIEFNEHTDWLMAPAIAEHPKSIVYLRSRTLQQTICGVVPADNDGTTIVVWCD